jgi:hypothetical protein
MPGTWRGMQETAIDSACIFMQDACDFMQEPENAES